MNACQRCSSRLDDRGHCVDETCPFSDHAQTCPVGWTGHPFQPRGEPECACPEDPAA